MVETHPSLFDSDSAQRLYRWICDRWEDDVCIFVWIDFFFLTFLQDSASMAAMHTYARLAATCAKTLPRPLALLLKPLLEALDKVPLIYFRFSRFFIFVKNVI